MTGSVFFRSSRGVRFRFESYAHRVKSLEPLTRRETNKKHFFFPPINKDFTRPNKVIDRSTNNHR